MRRGGALLATPRGPASSSPQRVEDEDEFENEDDLVRLRRTRSDAGYGFPCELRINGPASSTALAKP
jgi:hypothetical protein